MKSGTRKIYPGTHKISTIESYIVSNTIPVNQHYNKWQGSHLYVFCDGISTDSSYVEAYMGRHMSRICFCFYYQQPQPGFDRTPLRFDPPEFPLI